MGSPEEVGEEDKATTQSLASRRENAMSAKTECDVDIDVGKEKNAMLKRRRRRRGDETKTKSN